MKEKSLQDRYARNSICFGCGPQNQKGLRIKSFVNNKEVICDWIPDPHHEAFPGILNGGIIGSLLDCHCNWTAAWHLMEKNGLESPPCTVTAEYSVQLKRPTPSNQPVHLVARVIESTERKAVVEAELRADGEVCATCRGTFIAVKSAHPAYHRWS